MTYIGVFDSGVGGLTVFKEIKKLLPAESLIYLGDNARNPYGSKSEEKIKEISLQNSEFLSSFGVKMIVVACNTASAIATGDLQLKLDVPVVGVIDGSVRAAIKSTNNNRVGVIGTRQTIASNIHKEMINQVAPEIEVFTKATPLFAPLVEEGFKDNESTRLLIEEELEYFKEKNIDTLILGCTHYPLLKEQIKEYLGDVILVDPSEENAHMIKNVLEILNIQNFEHSVFDRLFVTDESMNFLNVSQDFLGTDLFAVEKVNLEEFSIADIREEV